MSLTRKQEDGVNTAIQSIYRDLEYAKTLIKRRGDAKAADDTVEEAEESWTFIGDDGDPELIRRIQDWETMAQPGEMARGRSVKGRSVSAKGKGKGKGAA